MEATLVYSKFLRKNVGQETKIYIMTEEEADAMLEKMPTGACLLRLDASLDSPKAPYGRPPPTLHQHQCHPLLLR
jgi:hypothetical protein